MSKNHPKHELEASAAANDQALEQALDLASQAELEHADVEPAASADAMPGDAQGSLELQLAESSREVLRVRAEMENYRKRMQRDSDQQLKYANVPLVRDLIEVVDNLHRALDAAGQESNSAPQAAALREGVRMVVEQFAGVLAKYGCKRIESVGHVFDPNVHEAIAQMPSAEYPAGVVMQEVATGYLVHDRVVRPCSVIVSSGPAK